MAFCSVSDGVRPTRIESVLRPRSCLKQKLIPRVKIPRKLTLDMRAASTGHEVEEVDMNDGQSEGQDSRRPGRVPTQVLPRSEEVDQHNILGHSQCRSWFPHCVVGRRVGQRHVASEKVSVSLPMVMMDYGYMNGVGSDAESEASQATGAVDENNVPIFVMNDRSKTL